MSTSELPGWDRNEFFCSAEGSMVCSSVTSLECRKRGAGPSRAKAAACGNTRNPSRPPCNVFRIHIWLLACRFISRSRLEQSAPTGNTRQITLSPQNLGTCPVRQPSSLPRPGPGEHGWPPPAPVHAPAVVDSRQGVGVQCFVKFKRPCGEECKMRSRSLCLFQFGSIALVLHEHHVYPHLSTQM